MSGNREYKSDVFSMLMQDKERALQLYNAMNGSSYDNPEDVEIVIHDGGISLSVRNDASFIVDAKRNKKGQEHLWQKTGKDTDTTFRCVLQW